MMVVVRLLAWMKLRPMRCPKCRSQSFHRYDWELRESQGGGHDGIHPVGHTGGRFYRCASCGCEVGDICPPDWEKRYHSIGSGIYYSEEKIH
jgi:DNA-directed RNA polymerase subunit RPC12/RpoP